MSSAPALRWREVTAVFGGTFDPPHLGHREAVRDLFDRPGIGRAIVLPSGAPPLKTAPTSSVHRAAMARLAFADLRRDVTDVIFDERELQRVSGPSYTFDTLSELGREHRELAFVIGTDQLAQLGRWHRFPEILGLSHWIVLLRRPDGDKVLTEGLRDLLTSGLARPTVMGETTWALPRGRVLQAVQTAAPALSSTTIRETMAKTGQIPPNSLLPAVEAYLKTHRLYGTGAP